MLPVKFLQRLGRKVASRVADRVSKNELFEQHGERPPQAPLSPVRASQPEAPAPAAASVDEIAQPPAPGRPGPSLSGCVPMDSAEVKALLGPGSRPRIVNHWATWCDPCIEELPLLVALDRRLGERAEVIGVSWDLFEGGQILPTAMKVAAFAEQHGLTWGSALVTTPPESFFADLGIDWQRIPQTWVVAPDGRILRRIEGVLDAAAVDELVAELSG